MKWPGDIAEAKAVQEHLCGQVRIAPFRGRPRFVAGVDAAFSAGRVHAAACLYRLPDLERMEQSEASAVLCFPYVPGLLSFREGPACIEALRGLRQRPDIVLVDGQGIAHPRGIGIASHIGVLLDLPTIGCAKKLLVGDYAEPGEEAGSWEPLRYRGAVVGAVLRSRDGVRPLFISPGHRVDVRTALAIVRSCLGRFRIPEPVRCADLLSKRMRSGAGPLPPGR